jgi:outer membrane lipoprotein-sorting protein
LDGSKFTRLRATSGRCGPVWPEPAQPVEARSRRTASYNKLMSKLHRHVPVALALTLASLSIACGIVSKPRLLHRNGKAVTQGAPPMAATRDELNDRIARMYNAINSFVATVDMTASKGSVYQGRITEYKDVRGFVLFRKPADIRIQAQAPVIRTQLFDMVSNGTDFRLLYTPESLFVEGQNSAPATSKSAMENLRPGAFLSSMLIRPADPATEAAALEDLTDEDNTLYLLHFMRKGPDGQVLPQFARSVWFDRLDLSIVRQMVFDDNGGIISDTHYARWQAYSGVQFPAHIGLNRWKDGYGVVMDIVGMRMNTPMTDDKFVLNRPEGSKLKVIGDQAQEIR